MTDEDGYYAGLAEENRQRDRLHQIEFGCSFIQPENATEVVAAARAASRKQWEKEEWERWQRGGSIAGTTAPTSIIGLPILFLFILTVFGIVWVVIAGRSHRHVATIRPHVATTKPRVENYQSQFADVIAKDALNHQNYAKAVYWYEISAKQGDVAAEYGLGVVLNERGANASTRANGIAWIRKSAKSGYAPAKEWLAQNARGRNRGH